MKKHRPRQSATQWAEIVKQFNASGMSAKDFCEQRDIAMATFSKWQRRTRLGSTSGKPAFTQVQTAKTIATPIAHHTGSIIKLEFGSGVVLTIRSESSAS